MSIPEIPEDITPVNQEQNFVHDVYNDIASHFSQTRYKPWPIVEKFLMGQKDYSIGIDVGCGNGKYLGVNPKLFMIGTDRSEGLIECAHGLNSNYNVGISDGLSLPHPDNKFDFAISIAVIHHFSTPERRIEAIKHILSKVKSGGEALIYCWALEQETSRRGYKEGDDQDILVPWVLQDKKKKEKKEPRRRKKQTKGQTDSTEESKPEEIPEPTPVPEPEPVTKYRYYHLYKEGELPSNAEDAGGVVVDEGYERDNWWVIIRKP